MITLGVAARDAGFRLTCVDEAGSTNDLALAAAEAGDTGRHWFVAGRQTSGRGRQGRVWQSPPGNLHATLLLVDACAARDSAKLGFVAGVATRSALLDVAPDLADVSLKWPNDVLIGRGKAAGVLLEGRFLPGGAQAVAIGIGVNVGWSPRDLPYSATSLAECGASADCAGLFAALSSRMHEVLEMFDRGRGFDAIRAIWIRGTLPLGATLQARRDRALVVGRFAGIDLSGRLRLDADGVIHLIDAADVHYQPGPVRASTDLKGNVVA